MRAFDFQTIYKPGLGWTSQANKPAVLTARQPPAMPLPQHPAPVSTAVEASPSSSTARWVRVPPPRRELPSVDDLGAQPLLDMWEVRPDGRLAGLVHGKLGFSDGAPLTTSPVATMCADSHAVTESGTVYRLGTRRMLPLLEAAAAAKAEGARVREEEHVKVRLIDSGFTLGGPSAPMRKNLQAWLAANKGWEPVDPSEVTWRNDSTSKRRRGQSTTARAPKADGQGASSPAPAPAPATMPAPATAEEAEREEGEREEAEVMEAEKGKVLVTNVDGLLLHSASCPACAGKHRGHVCGRLKAVRGAEVEKVEVEVAEVAEEEEEEVVVGEAEEKSPHPPEPNAPQLQASHSNTLSVVEGRRHRTRAAPRAPASAPSLSTYSYLNAYEAPKNRTEERLMLERAMQESLGEATLEGETPGGASNSHHELATWSPETAVAVAQQGREPFRKSSKRSYDTVGDGGAPAGSLKRGRSRSVDDTNGHRQEHYRHDEGFDVFGNRLEPAAGRSRPFVSAAAAALEDDGIAWDSGEVCQLLGCKTQLLKCYGHKGYGALVGCAEKEHVLCKPCLDRWFESQRALRETKGMGPLSRRSCPICRSELRSTCGDMRSESSEYWLGLRKLKESWL